MNPRFIIKGVKVNLRTIVPSDFADYEVRWNDPSHKAWDMDGPWYGKRGTSGESARRRRTSQQEPPYDSLEIETVDGLHIGWVVLHYRENDPHMAEIGIKIVEEANWDKGYGSEALYLWIDYLFNQWKLTRIGFSTWSGNQRIIAVGRRLGFVQEGCIRNGCEVGGKFYDRIKMGILLDEWEETKVSLTKSTAE